MSLWATSKMQSYQLPEKTARTFPGLLGRPLVWLNLICLDAPIVALLWQNLFARAFHLELSVPSQTALFATAWFIYLSDRFADTIVLPLDVPKSLRQEFCLRHHRFWLGMMVIVAAADTFIIWSRLDHQIFVRGFWLGSAAIVYLAVNYLFGKIWQFLPLKEIAIGFLFAAGTVIVSFGRSIAGLVSIEALFLFGCLCLLNCIGIAIWERDIDRAQSKHTLATHWPDLRIFFRIVLFGLIMTGLILGLRDRSFVAIFWSIAFSALFLFLLDTGLNRVRRDELTALADLALFTPLLGLLWK